MNVLHYFWSAPGSAETARWREAFPAGQALDGPSLLACLAASPEADRLVWLSAADGQWQAHLRQVMDARPAERVVLLSSMPNDNEELRALNEGAHGYAHEHAVPALLQEVALVVLHGGLWVGPHLMQRLIGATHAALAHHAGAPDAAPAPETDPWACLSAREAQVVREVTAGHSNKEVAALLHITERTVKAHLGAVFEKLRVRDRLQLVLRLSTAASAEPAPSADAQRRP